MEMKFMWKSRTTQTEILSDKGIIYFVTSKDANEIKTKHQIK